MLIYRKTSTLAVRHVFDPQIMGSMAEVVVKDGVKVLGHIAEEAASKLAGDLVKKLAEKVRGHLTDHSEKLGIAISTVEKQHARALRLLREMLPAGQPGTDTDTDTP